MSSEIELQHKSEIADAELGVAEELGWAIAFLAGVIVYLKWSNWLIVLPVVFGAYLLAVYRYRRRAACEEEKYFRVAGLGKYYVDKKTMNDI